MARLYEWEKFLDAEEVAWLGEMDLRLSFRKEEVQSIQFDRDTLRRKAVQRARNAMNKELRRKVREEGK